jgi:hypothetical protein
MPWFFFKRMRSKVSKHGIQAIVLLHWIGHRYNNLFVTSYMTSDFCRTRALVNTKQEVVNSVIAWGAPVRFACWRDCIPGRSVFSFFEGLEWAPVYAFPCPGQLQCTPYISACQEWVWWSVFQFSPLIGEDLELEGQGHAHWTWPGRHG